MAGGLGADNVTTVEPSRSAFTFPAGSVGFVTLALGGAPTFTLPTPDRARKGDPPPRKRDAPTGRQGRRPPACGAHLPASETPYPPARDLN